MSEVPYITIEDIDGLKDTHSEELDHESRQRWLRKKNYLFGRAWIIAEHYLTSNERRLLQIYLYSNHGIRDVVNLWFADRSVASLSRQRQLARQRLHSIFRRWRWFIEFFDQDYKAAFMIANTKLTKRQHELVELYLHLHSLPKCAICIDRHLSATQHRLSKALERLDRYEEAAPLCVLLRRLTGAQRDDEE